MIVISAANNTNGEFMYQTIIFALALATVAALTYFFSNKGELFEKILKCMTVAFCVIGFSRMLLSDAFVLTINGGWFENAFVEKKDIFHSIVRFGYQSCYAVLATAVFFDTRFTKNMASYVCLPFAILSTVCFDDYMEYFLMPEGRGFDLPTALRYIIFAAELVLAVAIPILLCIRRKHYINVKSFAEWRDLILGMPFVLLATMSVYIPQSVFGFNSAEQRAFDTFHLVWIGAMLVEILALYYIFRFKDRNAREALLSFLTIVLLFHSNSIFQMGFIIKRLPIQLCSIASFFYFICINFKLEKMFHFCFLANIVGALIAILMPDFSAGDISYWNLHYIYEHTYVLMIPALALGLRLFPRLKLRSLFHFWVGYTSYFLFAMVLGTIINVNSEVLGETVNFFYMFDIEFAIDYFPFLTFAKNITITIRDFKLYPVIIVIIYFAFQLLCLVFHLLVKLFHKMEDDHLALRLSGIEIYEQLSGKESRRPKAFID